MQVRRATTRLVLRHALTVAVDLSTVAAAQIIGVAGHIVLNGTPGLAELREHGKCEAHTTERQQIG